MEGDGAQDERHLARALGHLGSTLQALADEVTGHELGWLVRTPSLPLVWALNQLRVTRDTGAGEVLAAADKVQGGLGYRHIVVEHPRTAAALEAYTTPGEGWTAYREVLMVLLEPPDRLVATERAEELQQSEMLALMRRWESEERPLATPDELDQLAEYTKKEGELWGEVCLGVRDQAGRALALTKLRADLASSTGWVEDVYTVPEARGRGIARSLVTRAIKVAQERGLEFTFIVADDNDWPKQLYAKLGFRPVGRLWTFHQRS